jgi:predicted RNA-binding Zn-ribbon protein involved in translation (DUF1610 family)
MKRYGVTVCSECKRVWGIDLSQRTAKCPQCGKIYNVAQRKIFYQTSDLRKLQIVIAKIQVKLMK